ncbi:MAG: class I SAM-dependent rRNA methyltransferase [Burkholderiales bacterium]|nr:class I SAM-dependent rRNA methyltransferase [Burkholderiales bacterium]
MHKLILKPGREKSLKRKHPWVFSGAVARVEGEPKEGETVAVRSSDGEFLAVAAYSPNSQIRARVWDWKERTIDGAFFNERIKRSVAQRRTVLDANASDAMRLVHGESDGLPGIIADRYGDTVVVQLTSAGAERWKEEIAEALLQVTGAATVWERSDAEVRHLEGLPPRTGLLRGTVPAAPLMVSEHGLRFEVGFEGGHKTGFYLDQRDNRLKVRALSAGRDALDCFCYSGGFALNMLKGGAKSVTAIDSSADALAQAQRNAALNQLPQADWMEGDVFQSLRRFRDQGRSFDLIVLDPPKFAPTVSHVEKAARAYKDINLLGFKLLRPGGVLVTFSCSGGVSADLFQKIIAGAALDAGVDARVTDWLHAAPDHPVALNFPEGEYLKGLICRVGALG